MPLTELMLEDLQNVGTRMPASRHLKAGQSRRGSVRTLDAQPTSYNLCASSTSARAQHTHRRNKAVADGKAIKREGSARACPALAVNGNNTLQPGVGSTARELAFEIREAKEDAWWQVAEIHCRSFYPRTTCLMGVLLRFDRVESLKNGQQRGSVRDTQGSFACFGAWLRRPSTSCDLLSAEGIMRAQAYKRMPKFLQLFVARPLRANFGKTPEDCGMVGTVIVDSLGEFVPQRSLKGFSPERSGIAYLSNLAVDQSFRRKGVGSSLLKHAIEAARSWKCRSIILQCDPRNKGARNMYKDNGFRHVAYEPHFLQFLEGRVGTRLELMLKRL